VALLLTLTLGRTGLARADYARGRTRHGATRVRVVTLERRSHSPMLDLKLFRNPDFAFAHSARSSCSWHLGDPVPRAVLSAGRAWLRGRDGGSLDRAGRDRDGDDCAVRRSPGRSLGRAAVRDIGLALTTLGFAVFIGLHVTTPVWVIVVGS